MQNMRFFCCSVYNIRYSSVTNENLTDVSMIVVNMTLQIELLLPSSQIQLDVNSFNSNLHKIEKLQRRACKLILGTDYISLEDARRQLNMLSFEELVFVNKAKVMFKVTQGISPIYITEMFQIKGCNNEDTMTLRSDSNKNFKTPKPKLNMFKNSVSYSGTLIWNSIPLEIRNANTIGDFVKKCITWMKDL